jgi:hypothetical protein
MQSPPFSIPPGERTNEREMLVGEGFLDQLGRPTVAHGWYRVADHEPSGLYGVIVAGPFFTLPHTRRERSTAPSDPQLLVEAVADAVGRMGPQVAGEIAAFLTVAAKVAEYSRRGDLAYDLEDLVLSVHARADYHARHPTPACPDGLHIIELAPERV